MDLVYRHPASDGELWQGDRFDVEAPTAKPDVVVLMAEELTPNVDDLRRRFRYTIYCPIDDGKVDVRIVRIARAVPLRVADHVAKGRRVLVTCNMGLNRSGLITALALKRLGATSEQAISWVRKARADAAKRAGLAGALCNPAFEKLVRAG